LTYKLLNSMAAALTLVLAGAGSAAAADGAALFKEKGCISCHGPEGSKPTASNYPILKGQNEAYLVQQIKDIQSGARDNGMTAMMRPIVKPLSEAEIKAIAAYLSSL